MWLRHVDGIIPVPGFRRHLWQRQAAGDPDIQRQPIEPAELFRATLHAGRDRRDVGDVDNVGEGLAAFGRDLPDCIVGRLLAYVDAGDRRALAREQHRHGAAVSDRRILVDDVALARADHDDAAAGEPAMAFCQPERLRMQRGGRVDLLRRVGGDRHRERAP